MGGKSQTTTTNSQQTNTPTGAPQMLDIWNRVKDAASTPYTPYGGQLVAGLSGTQQAGINNINAASGSAQPYFDEAAAYGRQGAAAIDPAAISRYQNPYTQQVIDATRADFNNQNAVQQNMLRGNQAARGALGGNRAGIAQAELATNQRRSQDPVIAGMYSQAYDKALGAAQQDRSAAAQGAYTFGALAPSVQNAQLQGAQAQIGAGGLEQGNEQSRLSAAYDQYLKAQAYPYQQAGFLASAGLPALTGMGGTTTGHQDETKPGPSPIGQIAGLGLAAYGAFSGNPMAAMGGLNSAFGGAQTGYTGNTTMPFAGQPGATTSYMGGVSYPMLGAKDGGRIPGMASGGRVGARFLDTVHRIRHAMRNGGAVSGYADGGEVSDRPPLSWRYRLGGEPTTINDTVASTHNWNTRPIVDRTDVPAMARGLHRLGRERARQEGYADGGDVIDPTPAGRVGQGFSPFATPPMNTQPNRDLALGMGDKYQPEGAIELDAGAPMPRPRPDDLGVPPGGPGALPPIMVSGTGPDTSDDVMAFAGPQGSPYALPAPTAPQMPPEQNVTNAPPTGGSGLFGNLSDEARMGLISAGLGMAASKSPFALSAIGEGGLQGVKTYGEAKARKDKIESEAKRLAQSASQFAQNLGLHRDQLSETSRHHTETLAEQKRQHDLMADRESNKLIGINEDGFPVYMDARSGAETIGKTRIGGKEKPETIGTTKEGFEIKAVRDRKTGDYRIIDPNTGKLLEPGEVPQGARAPGSFIDPKTNKPITQADAGADDGVIPANARLVSSGMPHDYSSDAPYIEKGMDVPKPASVGGKSTAAIQTDAENYLQTGKLPPVARGKSPVAVQQNNYRNAVQNYAGALAQSRGLSPEQTADMWRTAPGMLRFVLGADGRSTVALGTAVRHLDSVQQLANAWAANDTQAINRLRAVISRQFGSEAATNLEAAGRIVGPEIIKALGVAGAGTEHDRNTASEMFSSARSPAQLKGAVETVQKLLGGQLEGRKRQAANAGVSEERFKSLIGDRPYEILSSAEKHGAEPAGAAQPGGAPSRPGTVPVGSQYSPSRKMWRDSSGKMYDAEGKPVQ